MLKIIIAGALTLAAGSAFADVPLFRAAPPGLSLSTAARIAKDHPTKSVVAVDPDSNAINTTVINVQLGGKTYRFVGAKQVIPPIDIWQPGASKPSGSKPSGEEVWSGRTAEGDTAWIAKNKLGVTGDFYVGGKTFLLHGIEGRSVLIEVATSQDTRPFDGEPTPQMIDAARKRQAQERSKAGVKP